MNSNHVIIMAGGIGSRFWPLSTPENPKQFIDIMGTGRTLIQMTFDRFSKICSPEHIWVVTNALYVATVHEQLPDVPMENILAEPVGRNTAPCIGYACWKIQMRHPHANVVVTPSDALVLDPQEFCSVITEALEFTADSNAIVTVGIKPNRPETGYGYIHYMTGADAIPCAGKRLVKVAEFREKPDLATAKSYLSDGNYLWNAGIFIWNIKTITGQLREHTPELAAQMDEMSKSFYSPSEPEVVAGIFPQCQKISIDYAVMEKSKDIYTIPAEFGWSDLGNWASLHNLLPADECGNTSVGNVKLYECSDCVVHVADSQKVVLQGLDGYIVSQKNGRLLVCRRSEEQRIKDFSAN